MLVLFETPAGFALFKILDDAKVTSIADIEACFQSEKKAKKMYNIKKMNSFTRFPYKIASHWKPFKNSKTPQMP